MKRYSPVLFLSLALMTMACTGQGSSEEKTALDQLSNSFALSLEALEAVVVVPASGCDDCISDGESLLLQELVKDESTYNFIITGYESRKDAMIRFQQDPSVASFIHLDTLGKFNKEPYVTSAPKIFLVEEGQFAGEGEIQFDGSTYITH
ncbi:MAG: hypothetical protein AAFQ98_26770 [Bacteroidota bacterium]